MDNPTLLKKVTRLDTQVQEALGVESKGATL